MRRKAIMTSKHPTPKPKSRRIKTGREICREIERIDAEFERHNKKFHQCLDSCGIRRNAYAYTKALNWVLGADERLVLDE